jgi:hypothetical protein
MLADSEEARTVRKAIFIVLGVVFALACVASIVAGTMIFYWFGTDGRYQSTTGLVTQQTRAISSPLGEIEGEAPLKLGAGELTIEADSTDPARPLFMGVGRTEDVDRYLAGVEHSTVTDVQANPLELVTTPSDGAAAPADPLTQTFWVVYSSGSGPLRLDWTLQGGNYRFVLMQADGQSPIAVRARVAVTLPWIFPVGVVLIAIGIVLFFVSLTFFLSSNSKRRKVTTPTLPAAPPLPTPLGGPMGPTP